MDKKFMEDFLENDRKVKEMIMSTSMPNASSLDSHVSKCAEDYINIMMSSCSPEEAEKCLQNLLDGANRGDFQLFSFDMYEHFRRNEN